MRVLENLIKFIKNEKGFTTQDVATGLTMAVLVGAMATVTANSIILDTEERMHIFNAKTIAKASEHFVLEQNLQPHINQTKILTLDELYRADKVQPVVDPSSQEGKFYNKSETKIQIENVASLDTGKTVLRFYVRLAEDKSASPFIYTDHTNALDPDRVEIKNLKAKHIKIPGRSA